METIRHGWGLLDMDGIIRHGWELLDMDIGPKRAIPKGPIGPNRTLLVLCPLCGLAIFVRFFDVFLIFWVHMAQEGAGRAATILT